MKKLIIYTLLFLSPFIIAIAGIEILLRKIPNNYMIKGDFLKKGSDDVKIIILGSSHGIIGIDPDAFSKKAFNIANYSQSLDVDYKILNKYQNNIDSLEYIILPISYFLPWVRFDGERCKYYNLYYDIYLEKNPLKLFLLQDKPIRFNLIKIKDHYFSNPKPSYTRIAKGYDKTDTVENFNKIESHAKIVVPLHTIEDLTVNIEKNIEDLRKIIEIGKKRNAKILLVTTPAHSLYTEHLDQKQLNMMYAFIHQLVDNKNVFYYDGLNDFNKTDTDRNNFKLYSDADHLSHLGAERFTLKLDSIIQVIDKQK